MSDKPMTIMELIDQRIKVLNNQIDALFKGYSYNDYYSCDSDICDTKEDEVEFLNSLKDKIG